MFQHEPIRLGPAGAPLWPGQFSIRAMTTADAGRQATYFRTLSPASLARRFMTPYPAVPESVLEALVPRDLSHRALIAVAPGGSMLAEARWVRDGASAEFALSVAETARGRGLGPALLRALEADAISEGTSSFWGAVLRDNLPMLTMCRRAGFTLVPDPDDPGCWRATRHFGQAAMAA